MAKGNPTDRFWRFVDKSSPDGCWLWTGATTLGYGRFGLGGKSIRAHRVAWELTRGPIPAGMTLDHLCHTTTCVRPDHLEPVSQSENSRRGSGVRPLGHVRHRNRPRAWEAIVTLPSDGSGKPRKKYRSFATEAEAREWATTASLAERSAVLQGDPAQAGPR